MFLKQSSKNTLPTIINENTECIGDIVSESEILIDGKITGNVRAALLTINASAFIEGNVIAEEINLYGNIHGKVRARKIHLHSNSHIEGDVIHESITIETGAFIHGACQHQNFLAEENHQANEGADNTNILTHPKLA